MEVSKKDLEHMFACQADRVAMESDERMGKKLDQYQNRTEKKMDEYQRRTETYVERKLNDYQQQTKQYIDNQTKKSDERIERYIGAVTQDFQHKMDAVLEYVKDIPAIKERQEMMFETMGEMAEDITVIKESVKDHEHRLQKLEARR